MMIQPFNYADCIIPQEPFDVCCNWRITAGSADACSTFKRIITLNEGGLISTSTLYNSKIFEDDLAGALNYFKKFTVSKSSRDFETRLRYIDASGTIIYILCRAKMKDQDWNGNPANITGCLLDITQLVKTEKELVRQNERYQLIADGISAGIWDWDIINGRDWWSDKLYMLLGYLPGEIEASNKIFINSLVHPEDKAPVQKAINNHFIKGVPYSLDIRMKTKTGIYKWFETSGKASFDKAGRPVRMAGSIIDITERVNLRQEEEKHKLLMEETEKLIKAGSWEITLTDTKPRWSKQVYDIHEVAYDEKPDINQALDFYCGESKNIISQAFSKLVKDGTPYDLELEFITAKNRRIWVKTIGYPVRDNTGKITGAKGTFQDIDQRKSEELELQQSHSIIDDQNKRLKNFAHIVSHNLRSHAGNIQSILELIETTTDITEKLEMTGYLHKTSDSLNRTIEHLNEVVKVQTEINEGQVYIEFQKIFNGTVSILSSKIKDTRANINACFCEATEIKYVPAYLESIMLNLISNAIKYRHTGRRPSINVRSFTRDGKVFLEVTDNGLGINLEKNKDKLFGMYKTFHANADAKGIGLFITRNQVEALGGKISVKSEQGAGSTFLVQF